MTILRKHVDDVEKSIPKNIWPIPSVTDLLYRV